MCIFLGDSSDSLKNIASNSVNLVITSPPYDNLRNYESLTFEVFTTIANELYRILVGGGVIVWVVGDSVIKGSETGSSFKQVLYFKDIGFNIHDTMLYEKNTSSFPAKVSGNRYTQIFEYTFILSKGKPNTAHLICDKPNKWAGWVNWGRNSHRDKDDLLKINEEDIKPVPPFSPRNNIFKYSVGCGYGTKNKKVYEHPASFPENLAIDHLLTWSEEQNTVLDPFMGSGTVGVACKRFNRKFIGIEISDVYFNLAKERIELTEYKNETRESWVDQQKVISAETDWKDLIKRVSTQKGLNLNIDNLTKEAIEELHNEVEQFLTNKKFNPSVLE